MCGPEATAADPLGPFKQGLDSGLAGFAGAVKNHQLIGVPQSQAAPAAQPAASAPPASAPISTQAPQAFAHPAAQPVQAPKSVADTVRSFSSSLRGGSSGRVVG